MSLNVFPVLNMGFSSGNGLEFGIDIVFLSKLIPLQNSKSFLVYELVDVIKITNVYFLISIQ